MKLWKKETAKRLECKMTNYVSMKGTYLLTLLG